MITKILLVDVSSTDLLIIKNMLSDFTVFTSRNGVEALKAIEENPDIDLVVLDLNMPVMDVTIVDTSSYTSQYEVKSLYVELYEEMLENVPIDMAKLDEYQSLLDALKRDDGA